MTELLIGLVIVIGIVVSALAAIAVASFALMLGSLVTGLSAMIGAIVGFPHSATYFGAAVGGIIGFFLTVAGLYFARWRQRRQDEVEAFADSDS